MEPHPPQADPPPPDAAGDLDQPQGAIPEAGRLGWVIDKLGALFALGVIASMLILLFEVVMRYVFNAPTLWAHETTTFLSATVFVFGGLYCVARDRHIRVVLLYDYVDRHGRRALNVVISAVTFVACCLLAYAAWQMVERAIFAPDGSVRFEGSGSAWNPIYPALTKLFLLVVLVVMAVQFLVLTWNYLRGGRR